MDHDDPYGMSAYMTGNGTLPFKKLSTPKKSKNFSWANLTFFIDSRKKVINKKSLKIEDFHLLHL